MNSLLEREDVLYYQSNPFDVNGQSVISEYRNFYFVETIFKESMFLYVGFNNLMELLFENQVILRNKNVDISLDYTICVIVTSTRKQINLIGSNTMRQWQQFPSWITCSFFPPCLYSLLSLATIVQESKLWKQQSSQKTIWWHMF